MCSKLLTADVAVLSQGIVLDICQRVLLLLVPTCSL